MEQTVIQIDFWVGVITLLGFLFAIASAWTSLTKDVGNIKDQLKDIKGEVKEMSNRIGGHDCQIVELQAKYGVSKSPMTPNEKGDNLLEESGFKDAYKRIKVGIFDELDKNEIRTLYDAQKESEKILFEMKNDPVFDKLKNYSVNHPEEPLELIFAIASWVIRDDYSKERGIFS